ncbi:MAG: hypothetical protein ACFCUT_03725 [Kiloniellaceae bacterium]
MARKPTKGLPPPIVPLSQMKGRPGPDRPPQALSTQLDADQSKVVEVEAEAASTEPQTVALGLATERDEALPIGAAKAVHVGIATEGVGTARGTSTATAVGVAVGAETLSTGLYVNRERDRIEISGSDAVRAGAARKHVKASRSKLEAVQRELEGLRGNDEQSALGDNRQEAPLSKEALDTLRHTVASAVMLHEAPLLSRDHVGILERIAEFLRHLKAVLDELSGVAGSLTTLAGKVGAAYLALKELCDMLLSALGGS